MTEKNSKIKSAIKFDTPKLQAFRSKLLSLSFQQKFIIGLLSIIFISFTIGYFFLVAIAKNILIDVIAESNLRYAESIMEKIDISYSQKVQNWIGFAKMPIIREDVQKSNFENAEIYYLEEVIKARDADWQRYGTENPEEAPNWIREIFNRDFSRTFQQIFNDFIDIYGFSPLSEIVVTDRYGFNALVSGWTSDYYQADEDWWRAAYENDFYIGPISYDNSSETYSSSIAVKIVDENGDFIGIFRFDINIEDAISIIKESIVTTQSENSSNFLYENLDVHVIDNNFNILYSSENLSEVPEIFKEAVSTHTNEYKILENSYEYKSNILLTNVHTKSPNLSNNLGVTIIFEQPLEQIFQPVQKLETLFLIIIISSTFLLVTYAFWITTFVTNPIKNLTHVANKILEGNYEIKANVERQDEFGLLAKTFNKMTSQLIESNEYNQRIIETFPDAVLTFDLNKKIVLANRKMTELAKTEKEIKWENMVTMCDKAKTLEGSSKIRFEDSVDIVLNTRDKISCGLVEVNGKYYDRYMLPLFKTKDKLTGGIMILHDVSQQVEANILKTNFISLAAHQLRTPLGIIRWNLESIRDDKKNKLSTESESLLNSTYESDLRLISLVKDLLNASKLDENKIKNAPEEIDTVELLNKTIAEFNNQITGKNLKLRFEIESKLPKTYLDKERLHEVFENLISNAVGYSYENGEIVIKLFKELNYLRFEIKNWGIYIPENEHIKIFSKFYRATNAVTSDVPGTGLGLYVVKKYVDSWNGEIKFTSSNSGGTKFTVTLPIDSTHKTLE